MGSGGALTVRFATIFLLFNLLADAEQNRTRSGSLEPPTYNVRGGHSGVEKKPGGLQDEEKLQKGEKGLTTLSPGSVDRQIRPYNPEPSNATPTGSGIPQCNYCFGERGDACKVCVHGQHESDFLVPMTPVRTIETHPEEILATLEVNHHFVAKHGQRFHARRGEGPFGSIGTKPAEANQSSLGASLAQLGSKAIADKLVSQDSPATTEDLELGLAETSVPIMQMKDSQYCGLLGIGTPPQYLRPIFDTGSTNLWVVGAACTDETCTKVTRFDPKKSSTFRYNDPPVHLDITFGTGRIQGSTGVDDIHVGPYSIKQQAFGLVEKESGHNIHGNIFKSIRFEGIVGMGFPDMSSTGDIPIYDNIVQQSHLQRREFAFYVAKGSAVSALFFGGVDPRFYEPPIHMFPVEREHYWEVALDGLYIGNEKFCCEAGTKNYVIFDSGTSFNTMPGGELSRLLSIIPSKECDLERRDFLDKYPDITYVIGTIKFVLKPEDYLVRTRSNICKPAYMEIDVPSDFGHAYILGSVAFMRHFFTVFRRSDGSRPSLVGVARAKHTDENQSYLRKVLNAYTPPEEKKGHSDLEYIA